MSRPTGATRFRKFDSRNPIPEIRFTKPDSGNWIHETRFRKLDSRNPIPEIGFWNQESGIAIHELNFRYPVGLPIASRDRFGDTDHRPDPTPGPTTAEPSHRTAPHRTADPDPRPPPTAEPPPAEVDHHRRPRPERNRHRTDHRTETPTLSAGPEP